MIRVLLADDEHLIRGAIATLLGLEPDIEVVAQVARGDLVAQAVRDHRPDVIVLDIEMPGMDGLTVAETLPGHAVLMLSSFGRPGYLRRALAAGVRGFIPKDASADELATAIRKVSSGGRYLDPEMAASAMMAGESPLTERERDALALASRGASVGEIAVSLHLTEGTVRNYLSSAITKLGASNRITAIHAAQEKGWL
ncbi:response regulator transcription factor [Streptosporangium roseum]|uniref:Response regulator receiver protein n=1 Tax=Streptosporangium roseum (strain ATCC 12428 / DSM 43021 / JCM 3005 / KCTC 9067 / NCIMB 10171 / NRRL 2505 / NI 9100) TaxID=479432 RepID=D2ARZ2_STRRD|nr:response regulator transcription factor [Streptosporangium roseum]ACZ84671.1 response regulator receiver protein [Streptosporangium roseum DSM 43021]